MHTRVSRSRALVHWQSVSRVEIDHLVDAHHVVRGIGPGGEPAAEQIIHALVVQLAARFQRYCRDLHDAAIDALVSAAPATYYPPSAGGEQSWTGWPPASTGRCSTRSGRSRGSDPW